MNIMVILATIYIYCSLCFDLIRKSALSHFAFTRFLDFLVILATILSSLPGNLFPFAISLLIGAIFLRFVLLFKRKNIEIIWLKKSILSISRLCRHFLWPIAVGVQIYPIKVVLGIARFFCRSLHTGNTQRALLFMLAFVLFNLLYFASHTS